MKLIIATVVLLSSFELISQSIEELNYELNDTNYVVKQIDSLDKKFELVHYKNQLLSECELVNSLGYFISHGKKKTWYRTGELKTIENYWQGGLTGKFQKFHKNGLVAREDYYFGGELSSGKCFDDKGKEIEYCNYYSPLKYPGKSKESYLNIINKKMKYPKSARKKREEGIVVASALISKTGLIEEVEILISVSENIDNEVFRVLFDLPKFTPLKIEGKPVTSRVILPFNFTLKK